MALNSRKLLLGTRSGRWVDFGEFAAAELPGLVRFADVLTGDRQLPHDVLTDALINASGRWARISTIDQPLAHVRRLDGRQHMSAASYDPTTDTWTLLAGPKLPADHPALDLMTATADGTRYLWSEWSYDNGTEIHLGTALLSFDSIGGGRTGYPGEAAVWDPHTDAWTSLPSPVSELSFLATMLDHAPSRPCS